MIRYMLSGGISNSDQDKACAKIESSEINYKFQCGDKL